VAAGLDAAASYPDLVVAANRQTVCTRVTRWLIHDLRNPTQALTLLAGLMEDEPLAGQVELGETLREGAAHVGRSLQLLDHLFASARPGSGPAPVSLLDSLRYVAALHGVQHSAVALDLAGAWADPLPAVWGVSHEIELMLLNLLLNSLEALRGRAGGRIVVTAAHLGSEVRVTVADDGPGIAPQLVARAFEPWVTGWGSEDFAGLGLAASRTLAERHGGSLTYARDDSPGARFVLSLPAIG
jgi:C4-dicarboxylate-specific signal transduction histidine kinase